MVPAFLLGFNGFEIINFIYIFHKNELFWIKLIFLKKRELLIITKNTDTRSYSSLSSNSVQNFKANGQAVPVQAFFKKKLFLKILQHSQEKS